MKKQEYRKSVLKGLKQYSSAEKKMSDYILTDLLINSESYQSSYSIATYLAFKHEYQTQFLIEKALSEQKQVYVPKTFPNGRMEFVKYDPNDLQKTAFGLWEPKATEFVAKSELDMIHVPGLVFNAEGYRIGYGGGYYDRYLSDYNGHTISTIYPFQLLEFEPEEHDIPVKEMLISK